MFTLDEMKIAPPVTATVTEKLLSVELEDGRIISVPTNWSPRLAHGTQKEREKWTLSRFGVHWECLDEDISVIGMLAGLPSTENPEMIELWQKIRENIYELNPRKIGRLNND